MALTYEDLAAQVAGQQPLPESGVLAYAGGRLSARQVSDLVEGLVELGGLRALKLRGCSLDDEAAEQLSRVVAFNDAIESLDLRDNAIGRSGGCWAPAWVLALGGDSWGGGQRVRCPRVLTRVRGRPTHGPRVCCPLQAPPSSPTRSEITISPCSPWTCGVGAAWRGHACGCGMSCGHGTRRGVHCSKLRGLRCSGAWPLLSCCPLWPP